MQTFNRPKITARSDQKNVLTVITTSLKPKTVRLVPAVRLF
jgi:hypothetical protein